MRTYKKEGRTVIDQDRSQYNGPNADTYLEHLLRMVTAVEQYTGFAWKVTSHIRDSPNHKTACALDIAPVIAPPSRRYYAVYSKSDPVLYKREPMIRDLQRLASEVDPYPYTVGIFIEPDHLHIQLFTPTDVPSIRIAKWKGVKNVYPDSEERIKLPMTSTGYHC